MRIGHLFVLDNSTLGITNSTRWWWWWQSDTLLLGQMEVFQDSSCPRPKVTKRAKVVKRMMTFMLALQFPTERLIVIHLCILTNYTTVYFQGLINGDKYSIYFQGWLLYVLQSAPKRPKSGPKLVGTPSKFHVRIFYRIGTLLWGLDGGSVCLFLYICLLWSHNANWPGPVQPFNFYP